MPELHEKQFPGESPEYRTKRDELLRAEIELRRQIEEVARTRRKLPLSGKLKEDYIFEEGSADLYDENTIAKTSFSDLFENGKSSLFVYSFMYHPDHEKPCTSCSSILDGLNGQVHHIADRVNVAIISKAPIKKLRSWAKKRGWDQLRFLSSFNNSFNADYFAETPEGNQMPVGHVFRNTEDGIYHFYSTELLFVESEPGQNARHVDSIWPLWNVFDLTPEGRGTDWYPKHEY